MEDHIWSICMIVILLIMSAYFSATETAFTSLNRIKLKNIASDGNNKAKRVLELSENYDKLLTTILIGNNIVNIMMTAVSTVLFIELYGQYGASISTAVITVIVLIFGEISPKSLAKESPEKFAMLVGRSIKICMVILTPLNYIFAKWKGILAKVFKVGSENTITEDEIKTIVEEAEVVGGIEAEQSELIQNAIEFNELTAEEVMTPHVDIEAIDITMGEYEVAEIFKKTGYSRLPVYEDDLDKILGVLNQKDFHNYIIGSNKTISDFVKPVAFVAGTMKIATLLKKLQAMKAHIAIVVNEYGGTEGLVTMEDIIEELVGDIFDEHDAIMSQEVTLLQNGSYRVMCNANAAKIFDYFGIDQEPEANTINGWVVLQLDKLPEKGDVFEAQYGNKHMKVKVTKATARKAIEINLKIAEVEEREEE
ncbi:MAG: HlyC/CorC family transporter [[Eubacterium] brachy]|nr:HlyC/CorC family transporter [[Eubacterium] brachy]